MRTFIAAALVSVAACATTPPLAASGQPAATETAKSDCGRRPSSVLKSSMSPRLVVYRACKAQARADGKASEETRE
jgi:hypothetical protein